MKWIITTVILATNYIRFWVEMSRTGSILIKQLPEDNCIHSIAQMASTEKQLKTLKNLITAGDDITPINYNVQ